MSRSDLATVRGLKQRCQRFRAYLGEHGSQVVTDAELRAAWPGGADNRDVSFAGWIYCYGTYRAYLDRLERVEDGVSAGAGDLAAQLARLDAARAEPLTVALATPLPDGGTHYVQVHPKSADALLQMEGIERELSHLVILIERYEDRLRAPENGDALQQVLEEISYQHRLQVSIVCHPGPETPYSTLVGRVAPADWTAALTPGDILRLLRAHRDVNGRRVIEARKAFLPTPGGKPVSWETLIATVAKQRGVPMIHLMKHQDLVSLLVELDLTREAATPTRDED